MAALSFHGTLCVCTLQAASTTPCCRDSPTLPPPSLSLSLSLSRQLPSYFGPRQTTPAARGGRPRAPRIISKYNHRLPCTGFGHVRRVHVRTRVCVAALVHVIYVSCTMRHHSCMHRGVRVVAARGPFSLALPTSLALLPPPPHSPPRRSRAAMRIDKRDKLATDWWWEYTNDARGFPAARMLENTHVHVHAITDRRTRLRMSSARSRDTLEILF